VHPPQLTAVFVSLLRLVHLLHLVVASARLVCPGLCRVQMAKAKRLHVVPTEVVLCPHELVRRVCRPQRAKATRVLRLPRASPLRLAVAAHQACLFHAQLVMAIRLTRAPVLHPEPRDRLYRADQAYLPDCAPRRLDLCHQPVPGSLLRARQHEWAAEYSLDFPL
jgi:hypothetical protein